MEKKSRFLPDSVRTVLNSLLIRSAGILFCLISIVLIISLFVHDPYLDGFAVSSSFGAHNIVANIISVLKYYVGFIPSLFLFLCLGRFGLSLFVDWDEQRAPEYNLLRGIITLCLATGSLGLMFPDKTFGGMLGSIVAMDVTPMLAAFSLPVGIVLFISFCLMAGILLHIKWAHVISTIKTTWKLVRWLLSVFHLIAPIESVEADEEIEEEETEEETAEEEKVVKKKVRKQKIQEVEVEEHEYELPDPLLLKKSVFSKTVITPELKQVAILLQDHFEEFGIYGKVVAIKPGPIVTQYEFEPERGTRMAKVSDTSKDMTRAMATENIRIAHISGTQYIGVEMVNKDRQTVRFQTMVSNPVFVNSKYAIPLALGVNISGEPMYYDLAKMPHMLIAGRTGSGKSVFVQSIIMSIVYHFTPDKCKMIIIDPKAVDFATWDDIPHLITPVVTDATEAVNALKWSVRDMEMRYKKLQKMGVRNIGEYNDKVADLRKSGKVLTEQIVVGQDEETGEYEYETKEVDLSDMPYLVIIIDEVADLMSIARKEVEACVQRLAQKARAAGIHLVMATQRPSADVITGVIKANFPTRISFQARSNIDSMTTLGEKGAEQLLSCGDMLFSEAGRPPVRIHGAFVDGGEVKKVADFLRSQGEPEYTDGITASEDDIGSGFSISGSSKDSQNGDLYEQAKEIVLRDKKPTISYLQRRLGIGYNKAATLIEKMESDGVVSTPDASGKRRIL